VLLLHGFGAEHSATWIATGWARALERAGRAWLAPDLPGHGRSAASAPPDDLLAALSALLDSAGRTVDVVGYSLGGELALRLAASDRPRLVRRLVAGGIARRPLITAAAARALHDHVAHDRPVGDESLEQAWNVAAAAPGAYLQGLLACVDAFAAMPPAPEPILVPALLFSGDRDPIAGSPQALAARVPGARLLSVRDRDHRTALGAAAVKREAIAFLSSYDA
jgi:pimeloyl-ACP methyl ester carboxylesterase